MPGLGDRTGLVSLLVLSDGQPVGYDLRPDAAAGLVADLRLLAAEAQDAHLDPGARQPLTAGQQIERHAAHTRRTATVPGHGGWLVARLPFGGPGPEPPVLLGAGPTLVLTPAQALVLAGAFDVHATSLTVDVAATGVRA